MNVRRKFILTLSGMSVLASPLSSLHAQDSCTPLSLDKPQYPESIDILIARPGKYCLTQTFIQKKLSGAGHTGPKGGYLLSILCGNVELDMRGHRLESQFGTAGIRLTAERNRYYAKKFPGEFSEASLDNRFVTIRNGLIDLSKGEKTGSALKLRDHWDVLGRRGSSVEPSRLTSRPKNFSGTYTRNEYLIDNLKVLSLDAAVILEGSHNVIRNCIIETNGASAVFIAGPNVLIENCEIRVRRSFSFYVQDGQPRAAIVLRDGSNAIIRNNTIRVDYGGEVESSTHCILVKDGAKDVLIEGNTFVNVKGEPVTLEDNSQAIVRNNKTEQRLL